MEQICIYHGFSLYIPSVSGYLYIRYCFFAYLRFSNASVYIQAAQHHAAGFAYKAKSLVAELAAWYFLLSSYPSTAGKADIAALVWLRVREVWEYNFLLAAVYLNVYRKTILTKDLYLYIICFE